MIVGFAKILGVVLNFIYQQYGNYGLSLILFTLLSKIILFPINLWIQKNSIKMLKIRPQIEELKYRYAEDREKFMEGQIELFEKEKYKPSLGVIPLLIQIPIILALVKVIENPTNYITNLKATSFCGIVLEQIPTFPQNMIIPILAAISCIALCYFQNKANILQMAEGKLSKFLTGAFTTILTIYFVFLVPNGVGLYWIMGNIYAIIQLYILNAIYPPKKYVDYQELEHWRVKNQEKQIEIKKNKKKEKADYQRFFQNTDHIKLIFYSEKSGFYKYFSGIIEYLLQNSDLEIHYITSDPDDQIFQKQNPKLQTYYIGKNKLIPLFMKIEADMVVMTTPDLQKFYLKRSLVRKDVEYVYMDHSASSFNLTIRTGALDYYDTIFTTGFNQVDELNEMKKIRKMMLKNIVEVGYPMLDDLMRDYQCFKTKNEKKTILIAPSYQEDNILESCIDEILNELLKSEYKIIVRPHPQFLQRKKEQMNAILKKYKKKFNDHFYFELDFSSNETIYTADLVITDWSGIGFEFSFTTTKPTLYINTKMKVVNPEYTKIPITPMEIELRDKIGKAINKEEISHINTIVTDLIENQGKYREQNLKIREKYIFNLGNAGKKAAEYIMEQMKKNINKETKQNKE